MLLSSENEKANAATMKYGPQITSTPSTLVSARPAESEVHVTITNHSNSCADGIIIEDWDEEICD